MNESASVVAELVHEDEGHVCRPRPYAWWSVAASGDLGSGDPSLLMVRTWSRRPLPLDIDIAIKT